MNKEQYRSDAFISKWISGSLTPEENLAFTLWLQQHPEEQSYFDDIESIWLLTGNLQTGKGKTAQQRWQLLEQNMEEKTLQSQRGSLIRKIPRFAIPAAAAILIFFIYNFYFKQEAETTFTAYDGIQTITLPDSSIVRLNKGATISYTKGKWKKTRNVNLKGEAFFDVRKNNTPFIVHTGFTDTKVMGTTFNITATADSVAVACFSGKVAVTNPNRNTAATYLTAGWGSTVKKTSIPATPVLIDSNRISWSTGILSFKATPLKDVIAQVERHYKVKINLKNKAAQKFTGTFHQKPVTATIEIICFANDLSFSGSPQQGFIIF